MEVNAIISSRYYPANEIKLEDSENEVFQVIPADTLLNMKFHNEEEHILFTVMHYTLAEYWDLLDFFDWTYEFSDSHAVWTRGEERKDKLLKIARTSEQHMKLYTDMRTAVFNQLPKPERPKL